jgi:hypothetical protein
MTIYEYRLGLQGPWTQVAADTIAFVHSGHVVFSDQRDRLILAVDRPANVRLAPDQTPQDTPESESLPMAEEENVNLDFYEKRLEKGITPPWEIWYKRDVPRLIAEIRLLRQHIRFLKGGL